MRKAVLIGLLVAVGLIAAITFVPSAGPQSDLPIANNEVCSICPY